MADAFDDFVPAVRAFMVRLRSNNTRAWFNDHKAEYEATVKRPALLLLDVMEPAVSAMVAHPVRPKLFRPQRDVRFSADKSPYKDHCHLIWHCPEHAPAGFFLGISPDYVRIGAGAMGFEGKALGRWRELAAGPDGAALADDLARLKNAGFDLSEPEGKRVPRPWPQDHPQAALLLRKQLTVWDDPPLPVSDLTGVLSDRFAALAPVVRRLAPIL